MLNSSASIPLILASQSTIRQRALNLLGLEYQCIPSYIDEKAIRDPDPYQMALRLSDAKAREVGKTHNGIIIAGCAFQLLLKEI
jgi:predicted house-cleaning NTP pyrophosphatase (Maf/HAM1 superfamily)